MKRWLFGPRVDEPLAFEGYTGTTAPGSGSVIELLANRLGSIITAISVSTGAVAADYDYQAYGARVETVALEQPYGFTGREHDSESGLMHFRARDYDPETGTFLQVDPMEFGAGAANLFSYVENNPLNYTDPTGLVRRGRNGGPGIEAEIINAGLAQMREAALEAVAEGVFNLAMSITQTLMSLEAGIYDIPDGGPPEMHHCHPRYLDGKNKGNLEAFSRIRHDHLHNLMQLYMEPFKMNHKRGWGKVQILNLIRNRKLIDAVVKQFYKDMDAYFGLFGKCKR